MRKYKRLPLVLSTIILISLVGFLMYNSTQQGFFDDYAISAADTEFVKYQLAGIDNLPQVNNPSGSGCIPINDYYSNLGYNRTFNIENSKSISTDKSQFAITITNVRRVAKCSQILYDYQVSRNGIIIESITADSINSQFEQTTNECTNIQKIQTHDFVSYSDSGNVYVEQALPDSESGIEVHFANNAAVILGTCGGNQAYIINRIDIKNIEVQAITPTISDNNTEVIIINDTQIVSTIPDENGITVTYITNPYAPTEQQITKVVYIPNMNPTYAIQSTQNNTVRWILSITVAIILLVLGIMLYNKKK